MVLFEQLRISDDGLQMYINAHVNKADYFENMYIESVTIMTADKVSETAPELYTDDFVYQQVIEGEEKEVNLVLTPADFNEKFTKSNFSGDLFFVYVKCKGTIGECAPCRFDELTTVGVTFDTVLFYQRVMQYTRELNEDCNVPMSFIDFVLLWNGFKASVETEHWRSAIEFYNRMFDGHTVSMNRTKPCGCHG